MGHRLGLSTFAVQIAIAIALAGTASGQDSPEPPSKQSFDKGVQLYQDGDFAAAAAAFENSYISDSRPDTLFAWAQAARKSGDCKTAVKLFDSLLATGVAADNKEAVIASRQMCIEAMGNLETATGTSVESQRNPTPAPSQDTTTAIDQPAGPEAIHQRTDGITPWYKDPVGASLLAGGTAGLAVGATFFVLASSADSAKDAADNHADFVDNRDKAESRGRIATLSTGLGVALIGGGVIWYLLRNPTDDAPTMSAWMGSSAGGVAVSGRF